MWTQHFFFSFFSLFSFQNCILTPIILLAFLYHQCEGTEKIYCSVRSSWNDSALLWGTVLLPLSPMESATAATSQFLKHRRNKSLALQPWSQWLAIQCNSHHLIYAQKHTNTGSKFLWCYFWPVSELENVYKVCFWKFDLNFLLRWKKAAKHWLILYYGKKNHHQSGSSHGISQISDILADSISAMATSPPKCIKKTWGFYFIFWRSISRDKLSEKNSIEERK